jgi:UDP-N-acetyl-2-amino-2-deoxyglucuronate dehydrogenase
MYTQLPSRFAYKICIEAGSNVICEKPLVLNPWNIDSLQELEKESGKKVSNILQLRLHPTIIELRNKVKAGGQDKKYDVELTYITSRGHWYYTSWKGDVTKSGGIATNIGIHFYDMLTWIFGDVKENIVHVLSHDRAAGFLELERARVKWFLSINENALPEQYALRENAPSGRLQLTEMRSNSVRDLPICIQEVTRRY